MALGLCPVCEKLVAIRPKPGTATHGRQAAWVPVYHDHPQGGFCPGSRKIIL